MSERRRTPLNVVGPFYVEADCCTACGAPEAEAPDLIRFDDAHGSCYFHRQPVGPDETFRAIRALSVCCVNAVRYGGADPEILSRLARLRCASQCDTPAPQPTEPSPSIATFAHATLPSGDKRHARSLVDTVAAGMKSLAPWLQLSPVTVHWSGRVGFHYTWTPTVSGVYVDLRPSNDGPGRWALLTTQPDQRAPTALRDLHDTLTAIAEINDIRWFTRHDWNRRVRWGRFPF